MSSDNPFSAPPGNRGRQRPGPTIELEATEIESKPAAPTQAAASASEEAAMNHQDSAGSASASAPPPQEPPTGWARLGFLAEPRWRPIAAGAGALLLLIAVVLAGAQFWGGGEDDGGGTGRLEARIARLERQIRELSGRTPPAVDPKLVDELASRVAKLEAALSAARWPGADSVVLDRISTLEGAVKALDEKIGVVARRTDEIAVIASDARAKADATAAALAELAQKVARLGSPGVQRDDLDALVDQVAALDRSSKELGEEVAKRGAGGIADRAGRLALISAALSAAVERGDAYATELATAKALGGDANALGPLEPFAPTGVPSAASLGSELTALVPALTQAAGLAPRDANFLDRLQAGAERLVRIRPIDAVPGDDPAAVLTRIEIRAKEADIAGALAELAKLPAEAQAPAKPWIAKAQARIAALTASRRFAADALAALAKAP